MVRHLAFAVLLAATACMPRGVAEQRSVVIRNVTVIPMTGSAPLAAHSVVMRDGRITELGPTADVRIPAAATIIEGSGKYLIPGLFEMHAHTSKTRASALPLYVVHGVTTIRDQGSEHAEVVRWRREVRNGTRVGPRMLIAGPYLESLRNIERMRRDPPESRVEPFERARIAIGSPAEARRVIDSLAKLELDHFKVRTVQDGETYLALAAAAHAHGKRLVGHVVSSSPAVFLEAGQDGVEHGGFPPDSLPREKRTEFWRELAARDVGVVPTLVTATESVFRPLEYYKALVSDTAPDVHPLRPYLSRFMILDWREQVEELTPQRRAFFVDRYWPYVLDEIRQMRAAGVRIMAGSDVAVLNIFPGASLHEELRLFVDSIGMGPMEALERATREPAEWLGLADSVGTIAPGKVADLVLLDANPLVDITNTRRIAAVLLRGRLFQRDDLDALLAAVATMPDLRVNDWIR